MQVFILILSKKRAPIRPGNRLNVGSNELEEVECYKYLGVMVSSKLWKDHISYICTVAKKLIGMLYRQFYTWADTDTLRRLYITCIRPHLEYACQLWDPCMTGATQ